MDINRINDLRDALLYSPDNLSLRKMLASELKNIGSYDEAIVEYKEILKKIPDNQEIMLSMVDCYYKAGRYSTAIVVVENLISMNEDNPEALVLYTRLLIHENNIEKAIQIYQRVLIIDPFFVDDDIDAVLRISNSVSEPEFSDEDPVFIERPSITFSSVGGMEQVKKEIELKIIAPLKHPDLYAAYGKKIGGGILLYGPPGCGKTHLAKATAGQIDSKFISVGINDILDMWMGNSEKNLHQIFETARRNKPCVLFFDEIDALGASRSDMRQSSGKQLINQFLSELDGITSDNEGILVLGATNAPWHLDAAFRRPGRFDRIIFVSPPDVKSREEILKIHLQGKPLEKISYDSLSKACDKFSGADLKAVVDIAIEGKLEEAMKTGVPSPLSTSDILKAIKKHVPSTQEWFVKARNYALYANDSGLYDDILRYLNLKK